MTDYRESNKYITDRIGGNYDEDMNDIVRAFKKIFNNKNKLIGKNNIKKINNFISGR